MGAIDYLREHGLDAKVKGNRLIVSPATKLTADVRSYIKLHRLELMAEAAANDGVSRSSHWLVTVDGYPPFTMTGSPITKAEALIEAKARWPSATVH